MNTRLILSGIFLTFLISSITSQYATKMYEFPQYGFKIPFYTDAKVKTVNKGTANELIQFEHLVEKNNTLLYASFRIFTKAGCYRADSLYAHAERNIKLYDNNPNYFRIMNSGGNTYPLGWSGFSASATVDNNNINKIYREYQAYSNGLAFFDVDIITRDLNIPDNGINTILKEPGFNSILLPHNLEKLGIRVFTKGNVASVYDNDNEMYRFGRCDKFTEFYPYLSFEAGEYEPETDAELLHSQLEDYDNISDTDLEWFAAGTKLPRIKGNVFRVSFLNNLSTNDNQTVPARIIMYFFTFNEMHYRAAITVPFVKDDGKVYWYQDNEFTEKSVPLFEERLIEILNTIEKI